jgi:hypothetical protein
MRCNFHRDRDATRLYAGTPVCDACAERLGYVDARDAETERRCA